MTKVEAIQELKYIKDSLVSCELSYDALDIAIEALSAGRVNGVWVEDCNNGETSNWACSVCGCIIADVPNDDDHPLYAFCPCCGADMQ